MIECIWCHKPHNTQLATGEPIHADCKREATWRLQMSLAGLDAYVIGPERAECVIDDLLAAMQNAQKR